MLKRLATASVLTMAVGGVLMSAAPAMAGEWDDHGFGRHHGHHHGHHKDFGHHGRHGHFHKHFRHDHRFFDLHSKVFEDNDFTDNDTFAAFNCLQIGNTNILTSNRQNCIIGNVEND